MNIEMYIPKDYNHVMDQLQDYMLSRDRIDFFRKDCFHEKKENNDKNNDKNSCKNNEKKENNDKKKDVIKYEKKEKKIFFPREKDSLFWCFYIIKNGLTSYQMIPYKNIVVEKSIKIEYVEKIRKEKQCIKPYKFAALQNIENNLVHDQKINASTFLTLCVVENLNILFFKKRTYYELMLNDSDDIYIIAKQDDNKDNYGFQKMCKKEAEEYKKKFMLIENIDKPMKSITYYKVSELLDICDKLGIVSIDNKRKTKQALYESIVQQL